MPTIHRRSLGETVGTAHPTSLCSLGRTRRRSVIARSAATKQSQPHEWEIVLFRSTCHGTGLHPAFFQRFSRRAGTLALRRGLRHALRRSCVLARLLSFPGTSAKGRIHVRGGADSPTQRRRTPVVHAGKKRLQIRLPPVNWSASPVRSRGFGAARRGRTFEVRMRTERL